MTPSSGNPTPRPTGEAVNPRVAAEPTPPAAEAGERKPWRKPTLQRLGALRSVTGSDLVW
jgi:hypothetical protein